MQGFKVSQIAEGLIGSEIIKLAGEINEKIKCGKDIYNFTIGDFDSSIYPIPEVLKNEIINAYDNGQTNYPSANGILELRNAISTYLDQYLGLEYQAEDILIAGGARPLIYAVYQTIVDPQDIVIFPVPSWNNNHYTHLSRGKAIFIETHPENNFMPVAEDFKDAIKDASLIALCSPLNPTGTIFNREQLSAICKMVLAENSRRSPNEKPLYVIYDQIYWQLIYDNKKHLDPVSLHPEMRNYTIYIDGISKAFAATGVRVGWAFGPTKIIAKMKSILGHVGAWAPKAEQVATAYLINDYSATSSYLLSIKMKVFSCLSEFYNSFLSLCTEGYPIEIIEPQAAIYLTVKFDLIGKQTSKGSILTDVESVRSYLLDEAHWAVIPFSAFGSNGEEPWFRISVGTISQSEVKSAFVNLKKALNKLI